MSEPTEFDVASLASLLHATEEARDTEIRDALLSELDKDLELERASGWPALIASDASALHDRMEFLVKHPRRLRVLGGSAIHISGESFTGRRYDKFRTPLLFETPTELFGSSEITSGYSFKAGEPEVDYGSYSDRKTVEIQKVLLERTTGKMTPVEEWGVDYHRESPTQSPFIWSTQFLDIGLRNAVSKLRGEHELEYPDEFYLHTLSLLRAANRALGTKHLE